jgi:hypothetical protein
VAKNFGNVGSKEIKLLVKGAIIETWLKVK